jgi:hypothetical protein
MAFSRRSQLFEHNFVDPIAAGPRISARHARREYQSGSARALECSMGTDCVYP